MTTKNKCTGCKIFTLCLGDPIGVFERHIISQCDACTNCEAGHTYLPNDSFCKEFYTAATSMKRPVGDSWFWTCGMCGFDKQEVR